MKHLKLHIRKIITFNLSGSISLASSSLLISAIVFGPSFFDEKLAKPCSPSKSVNASPSNLGLGAKRKNPNHRIAVLRNYFPVKLQNIIDLKKLKHWRRQIQLQRLVQCIDKNQKYISENSCKI